MLFHIFLSPPAAIHQQKLSSGVKKKYSIKNEKLLFRSSKTEGFNFFTIFLDWIYIYIYIYMYVYMQYYRYELVLTKREC